MNKNAATACKTSILKTLQNLASDGLNPDSVHDVRTGLRKLQAYWELCGESERAAVAADCVSRLSLLRSLQVFERYLNRRGAPRSDVKTVQSRLEKLSRKLARKRTLSIIERALKDLSVPALELPSLAARLTEARPGHAEALHALIRKASEPKRKTLHELRLKIKTIRYQEEWLLDHPAGNKELVAALKDAQDILGTYEERAEFRKLAKKLDLKFSPRIRKDWRRARKRARALPQKLRRHLPALAQASARILPFRTKDGKSSAP